MELLQALLLALNRTVVLRFRLYLESLGLAAELLNQRLAAVRQRAYEAADSDLLSQELAAGIRRVKGAKQLGARMGNWLTHDQARLLLEKADGDDLRSARDLAMISVLVGCGLRLAELSALTVEDLEIRTHIGPLGIGSAKAVIFVPFQRLFGSRMPLIGGGSPRRLLRVESSAPLVDMELPGARESPRTSFGTWYDGLLSGCSGTHLAPHDLRSDAV